MTYLVVFGVVFGINLLPAFGPPTWAVLVLFYLHGDLAEIALVPTGAIAAAAGRMTLARATRRIGQHLPGKQRRNLTAAGSLLLGRRAGSIAALTLFALSPVPSAQLFEAAGLMRTRLRTLTVAFFAGRLVSYSFYVGGAHAFKGTDASKVLTESLTSPVGVLLQLVMLAALVALAQVDWSRHLHRDPAGPGSRSGGAMTAEDTGPSALPAPPGPRDADPVTEDPS